MSAVDASLLALAIVARAVAALDDARGALAMTVAVVTVTVVPGHRLRDRLGGGSGRLLEEDDEGDEDGRGGEGEAEAGHVCLFVMKGDEVDVLLLVVVVDGMRGGDQVMPFLDRTRAFILLRLALNASRVSCVCKFLPFFS